MSNAPTATDLDVIITIVDEIYSDLIKDPSNRRTQTDYAVGRLGTIVVRFVVVLGRYTALSEISAENNEYGIRLYLPMGGFRRDFTMTALAAERRVASSALVHEVTHANQSVSDPATYATATALTKAFARKWPNPHTQGGKPSPAEWLSDYYSIPGEDEAHAAQAAADIRISHGAGLSQADFVAALPGTEVYRRIIDRIGAPATSAVCAAWWTTFETLAYGIYCTWP